jgi:hypothetical protein
MEPKEITLTSGNVIKVWPASFEVSRALYQALLEECKGLKLNTQDEMMSLYKDVFCIGFSSKKIEACLWECFKKVHYSDMKIDKDTFEPLAARGDYVEVCLLVAKENVDPFVKGLYAGLKMFSEMTTSALV